MHKIETFYFPPLKIELIIQKGLILKIVLSQVKKSGLFKQKITSKAGELAHKFFTHYFIKKHDPPITLPLNWNIITPFQKNVFTTLIQHTKFGQSITYQRLAHLIGLENGQRAIGRALNKNPWPIVIPCHRVIKKNNYIGGFSSGKQVKKILLSHEQIYFLDESI
ncbi:methylated-DNA--[protein]-cysteine S-methyltransferase [Desulfothermus sp.]